MPDEITITIDGREVTTSPGKMVIEAANEAGIYVPYLCYHPGMKPYGACRMCVVEVEGARGVPASCTLPVREGMTVNTKPQAATEVRDTTLDLLLSEHPHGCLTCHRVDLCGPQDICLRHVDVLDRCVTCPKNERCELKDTTRFHTRALASPLHFQYRELKVDTQDPFYDRDYNLCIVCVRCVRACDELRGDVALTVTEKAGQVLVGTVMGESLLESGCEFCGTCIDVCPVGALTETKYKWERPARIEQSVCGECPVGCTMTYEVNRWEKVIRAVPELNSPVNHGLACFKGKFGYDYVNDKRRLRQPLVRRDGALREATWEEAVRAAADGLAPYRGEAFGLMASPRNTNEELYVAQKFARAAMGSNNVDVASNDRPGVVEGLQDVLGCFAGTMSLDDVRRASVVMAVNANLTEEQNVIGAYVKQAVREGTQQLIVIDHREVELTRYANLWLRPYPGSDAVVLGALLKAVIDAGLTDAAFVAEHCGNWNAMIASLKPFAPSVVTAETGVPYEQIERAARMYATGGPAAILFALDSSRHGTRRPASRAIANLALVTGNIGKPNAGVLPLHQGANAQGAWDMGAWPSALPGHVLVQDANARQRLEEIWEAPVPDAPGSGNASMFGAAKDGRVKAMVILGDHTHYEDGTFGEVGDAADRLEFLVVSDSFLSPLAERADVVFPAATWAEKLGTYTNVERRVQLLRPVLNPAGARTDLQTLSAVAVAMGASGFAHELPEVVFAEIGRAAPAYAGITHRRLRAEAVRTRKPANDNPQPTQVMYSDSVMHGIQWPCATSSEPGSPSLYANGFPNGKARLGELAWSSRPGSQDGRFPLALAHGRVLAQSARPGRVVSEGGRNRIERSEELVLHPDDANALGVREGQSAVASTADGRTIEGIVRISTETHPGVVSLTTLFGELAASLDASKRTDPMNHIPRLNAVAVRVEPASPGRP